MLTMWRICYKRTRTKCYQCGEYVTRGLGLNVTNVENMLRGLGLNVTHVENMLRGLGRNVTNVENM